MNGRDNTNEFNLDELIEIQNELKKTYGYNKNICDLIEDVLIDGSLDGYRYSTAFGEYVVRGPNFLNSWEEYYEKLHGSSIGLSEEQKKEAIKEFDECFQNNKEAWKIYWRATDSHLEELDLLHEQYLAVKEWLENPRDTEKIKNVANTYQKTNINVLEYLGRLKNERDWMRLVDTKGSYLAYVFTGKDSNISLNDLYLIDRGTFLEKIRTMYLRSVELIDQISQKSNEQSSASITAIKPIDEAIDSASRTDNGVDKIHKYMNLLYPGFYSIGYSNLEESAKKDYELVYNNIVTIDRLYYEEYMKGKNETQHDGRTEQEIMQGIIATMRESKGITIITPQNIMEVTGNVSVEEKQRVGQAEKVQGEKVEGEKLKDDN